MRIESTPSYLARALIMTGTVAVGRLGCRAVHVTKVCVRNSRLIVATEPDALGSEVRRILQDKVSTLSVSQGIR